MFVNQIPVYSCSFGAILWSLKYVLFVRSSGLNLVVRIFHKRLTLLRAAREGGSSGFRTFFGGRGLVESPTSGYQLFRGVMRSVLGLVGRFFWRTLPSGGAKTRFGPRLIRKLDLGTHSSVGRPGQVWKYSYHLNSGHPKSRSSQKLGFLDWD